MSVSSPVIDHLDLATKHIYLLAGCREYHPVEDIYCEVRNIRRTDETMRVFDMPVSAAGAVPKGGGKFTPRYAIFNHGWKIVPEDVNHELFISGEQITDDGQSGPACIHTSILTAAVIIQYEPPAAEIIRDEESLAAIEHMAFNNRLTIDIGNNSGHAIPGTKFPAGTVESPSDNIADAAVIAAIRGLYLIDVIGNLTVPSGYSTSGYVFDGQGASLTTITILSGVDTTNTKFTDCTVTGVFDGKSSFRQCKVEGVTNFVGKMEDCTITDLPIVAASSGLLQVFKCVGASPADELITFDMNNGTTNLIVRGFLGCFEVLNQTNVNQNACINFNGLCVLDPSCTAGQIDISGTGKLNDNSTGTTDVLRYKLIHQEEMVNYDLTGYETHATFGGIQVKNAYEGKISVNILLGFAGDTFPVGMPQKPVNNIPDALSLMNKYHVPSLEVNDDINIPVATNLSGVTFVAGATIDRTVFIPDGCTTNGTRFRGVILGGYLNGRVDIFNCEIDELFGVYGVIEDSKLFDVLHFVDGGRKTFIDGCVSGGLATQWPTLDIDNANVEVRDWGGNLELIGKVNDTTTGIGMKYGMVKVANTCTLGTIMIGGQGSLYSDDSGVGCTVNIDLLLNTELISDGVWAYLIEAGYSAVEVMQIMSAVLAGKVSGAGTSIERFRDLMDTLDRVTSTGDGNGNRTSVTYNV